MFNNESPFKAWAIAGQISAITITPILIFFGGGSWLADRMGWSEQVKLVLALAGIAVMLISLTTYLINLVRIYGH